MDLELEMGAMMMAGKWELSGANLLGRGVYGDTLELSIYFSSAQRLAQPCCGLADCKRCRWGATPEGEFKLPWNGARIESQWKLRDTVLLCVVLEHCLLVNVLYVGYRVPTPVARRSDIATMYGGGGKRPSLVTKAHIFQSFFFWVKKLKVSGVRFTFTSQSLKPGGEGGRQLEGKFEPTSVRDFVCSELSEEYFFAILDRDAGASDGGGDRSPHGTTLHEGFDAGMQGGLHWAKVQRVRRAITCVFRKLPMGRDGLHVGAWSPPSHESKGGGITELRVPVVPQEVFSCFGRSRTVRFGLDQGEHKESAAAPVRGEFHSSKVFDDSSSVDILLSWCGRCSTKATQKLEYHGKGNTIGEYAYFLAKRALSRSGSGRGVSSRVTAASGEPVPLIAVPSEQGLAEIDDVELPPITVFSEGDTDSGKGNGCRSKGKVKATSSTSDREFREGSVANTSRIAPGAALSAKPEPSSTGSFLGAGSSGAGPNTGNRGLLSTGAGSLSTQHEHRFDVDTWHEAHNPFSRPLFQQDLVLNVNGTKAVVSHGWQLDPVNPRFLARLAPYGVLVSQMPSWAVTSRAKRCKECHENGAACPMSHIASILTPPPGFLADHVISVMNAELVDMYIDAILSSLTPLMGVDVAAQIMSRVILYRQDTRLREGRAPRADPSEAGAPLECRVDVLVRPGAGCEQFLKRSFVPFQGAQYGGCEHQLPLHIVRDPSDAATYLTHILEDVVEHISAGAQDMGGSFGQCISQAFLPDRRVELPEGFEAGDCPLDLAGFVAGGDVRPPPPHPLILPSESELSRFPSTYHFGGKAPACLEEKYPGGLAYRHADGRVTGPLVAGGFDTSEDDSICEDNSAREVPNWPPARRAGGRGSLPLINEEAHAPTPPSSTVFASVPTTPSHSSQTSFVSVGSTGTFSGPRRWVLPRWFVSRPLLRAGHDTARPIGGTKSGYARDVASSLDRHPHTYRAGFLSGSHGFCRWGDME
ncbi:hypothetical protein B0H14DRAFT_2600242 [Mycena olivaceomarginata]|nr:hypothetical protein B0H14DRAFT_2600242 [Mycena olivaceomarginata]